ncbi:MAG: GlxA family transcriptional regulator [Gammaproteobacteria bacterium]|nr:GlxA family transcriptional regulator [Gammaproteobacteria bacterium]
MLTFPGANAVDVAGPVQVFSTANQHVPGAYRIEVATPPALDGENSVRLSSGLRIVADVEIGAANRPIDTLLISGGEGVDACARDPATIAWVSALSVDTRRIASVCTGAFVLAAAGLLDRRRATTHWRYCADLAERAPSAQVEPDALYVVDGPIYTSAGVSAGMDLALALVAEDLGQPTAKKVAQDMVLFLHRPGGQSQFSVHLERNNEPNARLESLRAFVLTHLHEPLTVERLALEAAMSPRHFARVFAAHYGVTPAKYVEQVRVEAARRWLEQSAISIDDIAQKCGFTQAETMRRSFQRLLHIPPRAYRQRFRTAP